MVLFGDGMVVGGLEVGPGSESGGEHKNGRPRSVEVGEEGVDDLEFVSRIYENVGFAERLFCVGKMLESATDGRAESDNFAARFFCGINGGESVCGNIVMLGMHLVVFDAVGADRKESAEADMESEVFYLDAFFAQTSEKVVSHIETGGRSGSGALFIIIGEDCLVAVDVGFVSVAIHI